MSERIEEVICQNCNATRKNLEEVSSQLAKQILFNNSQQELIEHINRRRKKSEEYFSDKLEEERYRADNAEEECRRLNYELGQCLSCGGCGFHNNPDPEEERRIPRIPCYGCGGTGRRYPLKETPKVFEETKETEQDLHYPKHERSE